MPLLINTSTQQLQLLDTKQTVVHTYSVSTAKNGLGEQNGSYQTPRGLHVIRAKIGGGCPVYTVFKQRRPTGEIIYPGTQLSQDWILTRILWLSGLEAGFNRLGSVDTMRRYIYIHGTADEDRIGIPCSKGCIRMKNNEIIELFECVSVGEKVIIC